MLSALLLLAAAAVSVACMFITPLYLVAPAVVAYALSRSEKPIPGAVAVAAFGTAICLVLYGTDLESFAAAFPLLAVGAGTGITLFFMQKSRASGFNTVLAGTLVAAGSLYLAITLPSLLSGQGAFALVKEAAASFVQTLEEFSKNTSFTLSDSMSSLLTEYVTETIVPCCITIGGTIALADTLLFRFMVRKNREALGLAKMNPLSEWRIPRAYELGIFVMFCGTLYLYLTGSDYWEGVMLAVSTLVFAPFGAQGVALVDWFILQSGGNVNLKRVFVYTFCILLFRYADNMLITIGFIEEFMKLRDHLRIIRRNGRGGRGSNKGDL